MDVVVETEELAAFKVAMLALGPYQLEDVVKRPVRMSAQYMHGWECSANEMRKSMRKKGVVLGNGSRKSGIHHRRQYMSTALAELVPVPPGSTRCVFVKTEVRWTGVDGFRSCRKDELEDNIYSICTTTTF